MALADGRWLASLGAWGFLADSAELQASLCNDELMLRPLPAPPPETRRVTLAGIEVIGKLMNPSRRFVIAAACVSVRPCLARAGEPKTAESTGSSSPVELEISDLLPGQLRLAEWKSKPIWILKRTPEMSRQLDSPELLLRLADPSSSLDGARREPAYARNSQRSIKPEVFVGIAVCPHAGCLPVARLKAGPRPEDPENWPGGFACQCHFATFDLAGRVFRGKPTQENIEVPRHMYVTDKRIVIGKDQDGEA